MNEITIGDKVYISAKRAAEITGYARDYVGQLCREGHVDAKMVGRSWYVYEPSVRAHRFGQVLETKLPEAESTTDAQATGSGQEPILGVEKTQTVASDWQTPTYTPESPDLLPELTTANIEELLPPTEETLTDMQAAWREWFDQKQKALETPELETPEVIDARNEAHAAQEELIEAHTEDHGTITEETKDAEIAIPLQRITESVQGPIDTVEESIPIQHIRLVPEPGYEASSAPRMDIRRDEAPQAMRPQYSAPISTYTPEYAPTQIQHGRIIEERIVKRKSSVARTKTTVSRSYTPVIAILIGISFVSITIAIIGTGYASKYLKTLPAENNPVIHFLIGEQEFSR